MGDSEALFLVYYSQSEVFELHIVLNQPVRAYNEIYLPAFKLSEYLLLLLGVPESAQKLYLYREMLKPPQGSLIVLPRKNGSRH